MTLAEPVAGLLEAVEAVIGGRGDVTRLEAAQQVVEDALQALETPETLEAPGTDADVGGMEAKAQELDARLRSRRAQLMECSDLIRTLSSPLEP